MIHGPGLPGATYPTTMSYVHVIDTETASLQGGVCDLAIVMIDSNFEPVWSTESLINPGRPIDPGASGVHHITDDMVADAPDIQTFLASVNAPFNVSGLVVAGHNVQFDERMLKDELPPQRGRICTLKLARTVWPDLSDHKLQTLRYQFKLEAGDAHRAMGDVVTCISLLKLINREKGWTLEQMQEVCRRPISFDTRITFGKHKGTKLKDIPKGWLSWALRELKDLDPEMKVAFTALVTTNA